MRGLREWFRRAGGARWRGFGLGDGGLALLITVVGQIELPAYDLGPRIPIALLTFLMTASLAWRRRAPIVTALIVMGTVMVLDIAWNVLDIASMPSLVLMLACYSSGAHLPLRAAVLGLVVLLVPPALLIVAEGLPGELVFVAGIFGGIWVAGRVVRSRRELVATLAERSVLLEDSRDEMARAAVAEERTRIARELHDVVAHCVNVMVVQAAAERRSLGATAAGETAAVLASIEDTGREALTEMRRLLGILRRDDEQPSLEPPASLRGLEALVEQVRGSGLPVALRVEGEPRPLAPGVDLSAYRIVQEALTNSLKHAGPASADVRVVHRARELEIVVSDDGSGGAGTANGPGGGHGLIGMRERVALFGGSLDAGPRPEGGYRVSARLPLAR